MRLVCYSYKGMTFRLLPQWFSQKYKTGQTSGFFWFRFFIGFNRDADIHARQVLKELGEK